MTGGELKNVKLLLVIDMLSVTLIDSKGLNVTGYLVKYSLENKRMLTEVFIPEENYRKEKLLHLFGISPQGKKKDDYLLNRLLKCMIFQKSTENPEFIDVGKMQGFNLVSKSQVVFESRERYAEELYDILPESILLRERPRKIKNDQEFIRKYQKHLYFFLYRSNTSRVLYLIRITSYLLTFGAKKKVFLIS